MKRISWVVMSALVMGFSVSAMQESEEINPNRKRRVSPCCNLGRLAAGIMVAFVGFSNQIRGVQAQSQVTVVDPNVNFSPTIPADVIAGQAAIQEIADEVRCYFVDAEFEDGGKIKLNFPLCHKPKSDHEKGRLAGHLERQGNVSHYMRGKINKLNIAERVCPVGATGYAHLRAINCINDPEEIQSYDISKVN